LGAAAAYNVGNIAAAEQRNGRAKIGSSRPDGKDTFEYTDALMEQFGTPEILIKELKMAKRDMETLKNQLEVKEKSVANYRNETAKLRKENIELKREILSLKERLSNKDEAGN